MKTGKLSTSAVTSGQRRGEYRLKFVPRLKIVRMGRRKEPLRPITPFDDVVSKVGVKASPLLDPFGWTEWRRRSTLLSRRSMRQTAALSNH